MLTFESMLSPSSMTLLTDDVTNMTPTKTQTITGHFCKRSQERRITQKTQFAISSARLFSIFRNSKFEEDAGEYSVE